MSGLPDTNFPAFHAETARLRSLGYDVVNPAEINADATSSMDLSSGSITPAAWAACLKADISQLLTCDAIALLPAWEKSRGATLEHHIATALGMPVHLAAELVGVPA
jgi:hypothetical protein